MHFESIWTNLMAYGGFFASLVILTIIAIILLIWILGLAKTCFIHGPKSTAASTIACSLCCLLIDILRLLGHHVGLCSREKEYQKMPETEMQAMGEKPITSQPPNINTFVTITNEAPERNDTLKRQYWHKLTQQFR